MQTKPSDEVKTGELLLDEQQVHAPALVDGDERLPREDPAARLETPPAAIPATSPLDKIAELIERGISPEQIDRYLDLQQRWEADQARKAYHAAMAAFKREPIAEIVKQKHVRYNTKDRNTGQITGTVDYHHETLDLVVDAVVGPMAKHGLTHKWDPRQEGGLITVRCVVTHELGHSDSIELFAEPDDSGRKNAIQRVKSTISYLERITLLAMLGLAAKEMDDDGASTGPAREELEDSRGGKPETSAPRAMAPAARGGSFVTEKQAYMLRRRLEEKGIGEPELCAQFGVDALEGLLRGDVDNAIAWIGRKPRRS